MDEILRTAQDDGTMRAFALSLLMAGLSLSLRTIVRALLSR
jgi:hypothetical protein